MRAILDVALASSVKKLVITGSAVSLVALDDCWKDEAITTTSSGTTPEFDIATIYPSLIFGPFGFSQVNDTPVSHQAFFIYMEIIE